MIVEQKDITPERLYELLEYTMRREKPNWEPFIIHFLKTLHTKPASDMLDKTITSFLVAMKPINGNIVALSVDVLFESWLIVGLELGINIAEAVFRDRELEKLDTTITEQ